MLVLKTLFALAILLAGVTVVRPRDVVIIMTISYSCNWVFEPVSVEDLKDSEAGYRSGYYMAVGNRSSF